MARITLLSLLYAIDAVTAFPSCDATQACGYALTCVNGLQYPTTCGPSNCDEPLGPCDDAMSSELTACTDADGFVDELGFVCSEWVGYECSNGAFWGMSEGGVEALLQHCAQSCGNCVADVPSECAVCDKSISIEVRTDNFPQETSWRLQQKSGGVCFTSPGYFAGEHTYEATYSGLCDGVEYEFILQDSFADGMCCTFGNGHVSLSVDGQQVAYSDGQFGTEWIHSFFI